MLVQAVQSSNIGAILVIIPDLSAVTLGVCSYVLASWDNYKDYTYVGTLDGLYQHTLIATGTRLRPVEATFLGHILGTKPAKNIRV